MKRPSDFQRFLGSPVLLKTYKPVNGRKEFAGRLAGYDNGAVEAGYGHGAPCGLKSRTLRWCACVWNFKQRQNRIGVYDHEMR